jgi:hypothetical protein
VLNVTHKICKNQHRSIEALCQSLGKVSGREGPDAGLAIYIKNFDNSVVALSHQLTADPKCLHDRDHRVSVEIPPFTEQIQTLAADLDEWQKEFTGLVFPSSTPENMRVSSSRLRHRAKGLAERCFRLSGKLDALLCMSETNSRIGRNGRMTSTRSTRTRTPSPMVGPSNTVGHVREASADATASGTHTVTRSRSLRNAAETGSLRSIRRHQASTPSPPPSVSLPDIHSPQPQPFARPTGALAAMTG